MERCYTEVTTWKVYLKPMRKMSRVLAVSRIVLFWMLLRRIEGEASSEETEIVASKVLPVVINTWGPPFTNATAEGRDGTVIMLSVGVVLDSNPISLK